MHCVVGSGPAGVACAQALLNKGVAVHMVDGGITLEPHRAAIVQQLRSLPPSAWDPRHIRILRENTVSGAKGIPTKLAFGSDFAYRDVETHIPCRFDGVALRPSLARGGFSNVWGAALFPYRDEDISDWPVGTADLEEHYRAVLMITGLSARMDDLQHLFPLYVDNPGLLEPSRQARSVLQTLERHRTPLRAQGIHFGAARLALTAPRPPHEQGCVYCGTCLHGCPYGFIYNSATTLQQMHIHSNFTYESDIVVTSLREFPRHVIVTGYRRPTRDPVQFNADRVYLAAGAIPTTTILLNSLQAYDHLVWIRDSQYFLVPLLLLERTRGARHEALHTLSQLFIEVLDPSISPHTIHLQLYTYNDFITAAVKRSLGPFAFDSLLRQCEDRLIILQGYLHSDLSSKIAVSLTRPGTDSSLLRLRAELNPATGPTIRRLAYKLVRNARRLGALAIPPLVRVGQPGSGFHSGGSFPMRKSPAPFETDALGRPYQWDRVHLVDASVFPTIPATTITLSVMANAHRIASESTRL